MKTEKIIGVLFIVSVVGVLVPYTTLTIIFDYPSILRQETGMILTKFHEGGNNLIWTWWLLAVLGLPLLEAYILLGQKLEKDFYFARWATTLGIIGLLTQMIGLLRWTFVVPILANKFVAGNETTKEVCKVAFETIHQYGGVVLGEHIGQLFTIAWTITITSAFATSGTFPKWLIWFGYVASIIYLFAQAELFATVIPNFPVVKIAGFLGSTLWLLWLLIVGIKLTLKK